MRNGSGKIYLLNGDRYEGDWKNNERNGYGIFFWNNGNVFKGEWRNDLMDG